MTENISTAVKPPSPAPTGIEDPLSTAASCRNKEYVISPAPTRELSMDFLFSDPLAPPEDIFSPSLIGYSQNGKTGSLTSTPSSYSQPNSGPPAFSLPQETPPDIIYNHFADNPAPPVQLFRYECKVCEINIFTPDRVAEHLVQHKHPESRDWVCTSCGKEYLKGRWGYGMLLMHLQGRGGSGCNELVDLRAQYADMFGEAGIMSTVGSGPPM